MKLAVCNDWYDKKSAVFWNKDGFLKMLDVLRKRDGWEIVFFKKHEETFTWQHDFVELRFSPHPAQAVRDWKPDAVLFFCDFSRPIIGELADMKVPKAICYSGGRFTNYAQVPDLVFTESKSYIPWMKSVGVKKVIQAFGTNTELFKPLKEPKIFDAYFPATGAAWKRHHLFAEALGSRGLVSGWWQPHEPECLEVCLKYGCAVLHHQMAESVAYLYSMSKTTVITSSDIGGSQRAVLESLSCNVPCIVMADSTMTSEYIREAGEGAIVEPNVEEIRRAVDEWKDKKVNTREWILKNYSEFSYADKVRDGILSL